MSLTKRYGDMQMGPNGDPQSQLGDTWDTGTTSNFLAEQRTSVETGHIAVVLTIDVNGITVKDSKTMSSLSNHQFTQIKCYQADEKRHTFAFLEVKPGGEVVFEFYLQKARELHTVVGHYIQQLLEIINEKKAAKKREDAKQQVEADIAARQEALLAVKVPALAAPPSSGRAHARVTPTNDLLDLDSGAALQTTLTSSVAGNSPRLTARSQDPVLMTRRDSLSNLLGNRPTFDALLDRNLTTKPSGDMRAPTLSKRDSMSDLLKLRTGEATLTRNTSSEAGSPLRKQALSRALAGSQTDLLDLGAPSNRDAFKMERRNSISNLLKKKPSTEQLVEKKTTMGDDDFFAALGK